jgi:hypothetical protein
LEKIMTLQILKPALLAAIVSTSFSAFAADRDSSRDSRMWLHPKLGYVKAQHSASDAAKAGAPAPAASASVATPPNAMPDADRCKPRFWVPPKGDMRRITPKDCR